MIRYLAFPAALIVAVSVPADALRYGDRLLRDAALANPAVAGLVIDVPEGADGPVRIAQGVEGRGDVVVLHDAMGAGIGTLTVVPRAGSHLDASVIAARLDRHIYVANNLVEQDPFAAGATMSIRAQALVEQMLARFPDLVTLALHVGRPGGRNRIIASSFGRIGKAGDADDAHVIRDGATLREVTNDGRRLAIELPLYDRKHRTIGALSTSFSVTDGDKPTAPGDRATRVRDDIASAIPSIEWLLGSPS